MIRWNHMLVFGLLDCVFSASFFCTAASFRTQSHLKLSLPSSPPLFSSSSLSALRSFTVFPLQLFNPIQCVGSPGYRGVTAGRVFPCPAWYRLSAHKRTQAGDEWHHSQRLCADFKGSYTLFHTKRILFKGLTWKKSRFGRFKEKADSESQILYLKTYF